jgi:cysteinyl-tRNA synthetase
MPSMRVYNTLARAVEPFEPAVAGKVSMYLCGPTVQSEPHLGHGRSAVAFDVLWRYLEFLGYDVTFVRNVTDVEDKIIQRANDTGLTTDEIAAKAFEAFTNGYDRLGNRRPTFEPYATDNIPQMIELVETLIERGVAYESGGDVYFAVRSFEGYGKLSRHNLDDLRAGDRVEPGSHKHDALDFALWKAAKPGEPSWESPWGPGRPGWHIECSAMARRYLGDGFDIHGGGTDLIFPHHENEIAQAEAATGHTFARYWMHNGMLTLTGEKMAKSTGHLITLLEGLEKWDPMAIRLFFLRTHYRKPLDFSDEALADAEASLGRLRSYRRRTGRDTSGAAPDATVLGEFRDHMDDDLEVAGALGVLFDTVRTVNAHLDADEEAGGLIAAADAMLDVLGLDVDDRDDAGVDVSSLADALGVTADSVDDLIEARIAAREAREFALSDAIRDGLAELGITIEDTADGTRWHRD